MEEDLEKQSQTPEDIFLGYCKNYSERNLRREILADLGSYEFKKTDVTDCLLQKTIKDYNIIKYDEPKPTQGALSSDELSDDSSFESEGKAS